MLVQGYVGEFPTQKVISSLMKNLKLQSVAARETAIKIKAGEGVELPYDMVLIEDLEELNVIVK
jgi:hypothetical protein